jgi:apolipoprotein N-acyltransferase
MDEEAGFLERARGVAAAERVYLAIGMATIHLGERLPFENKLVVIDPAGDVAMSYRKSHPVAGWEAGIMRPGEPVVPIADAQDYRMAGAICFDSDFPEFIRQAGRNRADLLVVPANDWKEIKELHAQMLAFRAIENGLSIVRSASSGLSVVVDPYGRTLAISDDLAPGDSTMTGQVPIARVGTVYARTGDLLAWACVAGLVLAIGAGLIRRTGDGITVSASRAAPSAAGAGAAASAADR